MILLGGTSSDVIESLTSSAETSSSAFENRWGYKIDSAVSYNPIPTSDTQIVTSTVAAPSGATTTLSLAAKVGQTKAQGAYVGNLVLTAVANSDKVYSITYNKNTSDAVSNLPSNISQTTTTNTSVTLSSNTPTRTNYIFQGWCTVAVADNASCTGTSYAAGAAVGLDATTSNPITLYAVWLIDNRTATISSNDSAYSSVSPSSVTAVYGSAITTSSNTITIGSTTITATPATTTAQYSYSFSSWTNNCGSTLSADCTIVANFTRTLRSYTVTIASNNTAYGSVSSSSLTKSYGSSITATGSTSTYISVGGTTVTATPNSGYKLSNWSHSCSTTLTGNCTITANFTAKTLADITTMQEMASAICNATTTPTASGTTAQYQLKDTRDNKYYWVAKLADGNCWMTQNLDFEISTSGTTLKTSDSNVASEKTITATNGWSYTDISFYEGGDYYLPSGSETATSTDELALDSDNWHYHVGNYYNWYAATAGSGISEVTDADAAESICPKGWRLPTSNSTTANYSFGKLLTAYSYSSSSDTLLLGSPLWFVRAGNVNRGNLGNQGSYGYVWSSRANSDSDYAYYLFFYSDGVYPSGYGSRRYGFSVRCVAE